MIQQQILAGKLSLPFIDNMEEVYGTDTYRQIKAMFEAMWNAYLQKGVDSPISLPYWAKRIKNPLAMNQALKILSDNNWITVSTRPNNNWAEAYLNESALLNYVTKEQLDHVRMYNKFNKYKLEFHNLDQDFGAHKQKANGTTYTTDFASYGFEKTGKVPFQFDTKAMAQNKDLVIAEINKGIEKMIVDYPAIIDDHANYREIGTEIVESLIYEAGTYNAGPRTSDPRRRNNSGYLNKIGNPVGFKVMRGLLVIPQSMRNTCTPAGLLNKYLFIAELVGYRSGTTQGKINFGRQCFYANTQAHDPVENIWLNRTYEDITNALGNRYKVRRLREMEEKFGSYSNGTEWHKARANRIAKDLAKNEANIILESSYQWQVPIEIDMSASVLGYIGLYLNHKPFLDRCNITHGPLSDAWGHDVVTNRDQLKAGAMRQCYGSQMPASDMWSEMGINYTQEELTAFNNEMESGEFAVAMAFKDFIINNAQMQPKMELDVLGTKVTTYCNKFHNVGETTIEFDFYDTITDSIRTVFNTETKRVPDLKSFKRYGPTGLIHGTDGGVMNNTVDAVVDRYQFCLDIHDAMLLCCESADYARDIYANGRTPDEPSLKYVHTHRDELLSAYFTSLNIPAHKVTDWIENVLPLVIPLEEELIINPLVLK